MLAKDSPEAWALLIKDLGLGTRTLNRLVALFVRDLRLTAYEVRERITAAHLMQYRDFDLCQFPGIGEAALDEIISTLRRHGFAYPGEHEPRSAEAKAAAVEAVARAIRGPVQQTALVTSTGLCGIIRRDNCGPREGYEFPVRKIGDLELLGLAELKERGFRVCALMPAECHCEIWKEPGMAEWLEVEIVAIGTVGG